jgi:outer membrane receptor for ferrienterochelin and colicins
MIRSHIILFFLLSLKLAAQDTLKGEIRSNNKPVPFAILIIKESNKVLSCDSSGRFQLPCSNSTLTLRIESSFTIPKTIQIDCKDREPLTQWIVHVESREQELQEVVISGGLREVDKLKTTVPVEVYSNKFLLKNPSVSILESLSQINGVRPQINCNICNTGDIHMNGLEGPYTMILIDGMPIISSLASVYGLSGIPNSMIERVEVIRGPSGVLFGSEAIGGVINIITKTGMNKPLLSAEVLSNTYGETSLDVGLSNRLNKSINILTGINYFNYSNLKDLNNDGFTDLTLQKRIAFFQRYMLGNNSNPLQIGLRYLYEDRWGGQTNWTPEFRGSDSIYAESIYTNRFEMTAKYKLPTNENIQISASYAYHKQNSFYGMTPFMADIHTGFLQTTWFKHFSRHDIVAGLNGKLNYYKDNTAVAVQSHDQYNTILLGIFAQDEMALTDKLLLLAGARVDQSFVHGTIFTPRIGLKYDMKKNHLFRINLGSGYRVVNVFTEDHAALTGSRTIVFTEQLKPEKSLNVNFNYYSTIYLKKGNILKIDISPFYSYFFNRILPDYTSNVDQIIYSNSKGYSVSSGVNISLDLRTEFWKFNIGSTLLDVYNISYGIRSRQILTERVAGTWSVSYSFKSIPLELDYTGNLYGPMNLPTLGPLDPRPQKSPWWSIQNINVTWKTKSLEFFGGVKNILNWLPGKNLPFLIARAHDPFDKLVEYDQNGNVLATAENPYALTFDPGYVYSSNQGIRFQFGVRLKLNRD